MRNVLFLLSMSVAGCTLTGLDRIPLPQCSSDNDCEPLNARDGIASSQCVRWLCPRNVAQPSCTKTTVDSDGDGDPPVRCGGRDCDDTHPKRVGDPANARYAESCDQIDNDCNNIIDDGAMRPAPLSLLQSTTTLASSAVSRSSSGGLGTVLIDFASGIRGVFLSPGASATPVDIQYRTQADPNAISGSVSDTLATQPRCPLVGSGVGSCNAVEMSIAELDAATDQWLAAAINTNGCGSGQLRLGVLALRAGVLEVRGPIYRSNVMTGVDVATSGLACTGASTPSEPQGATRPATTVTASGAERSGLVTFLQSNAPERMSPALSSRCSPTDVPVKALGVWLESDQVSGTTGRWFLATNNGLPQSLGTTRAFARPATLTLDTSSPGFLVGHASNNGVVISVIGSLPTPPAYSTAMLSSTMPRPTSPLTIRGAFTIPATNAADVAVAVGAVRADNTLDVGVAWHEGCDLGNGTIKFARIALNFAMPGNSTILTAPTMIAQGDAVTLSYAPTGFVETGFARGGMSPATDQQRGGWFVTWTDRTDGMNAVRMARVLAYDGAVITEPLNVLSTGTPASTVLFSPHADSSGRMGTTLYSYRSATSLFQGDLVCPAAN